MAACTATTLAWRKPTTSEVLDRIVSGDDGNEQRPVLAVHECSLTARHKGDHDFRTHRWIIVRRWVRVAVVLVLAAVVVFVGGLDSPNLH